MQSVSYATSVELLGTSTCLAYTRTGYGRVTLLERGLIQGWLNQDLGEIYMIVMEKS